MDAAYTLKRILWELEKAAELLNEAYTISLWVKADDCSDNRRRRTTLREADWEVSAAMRNARELQIDEQLEKDLQALMMFLEPLPDFVTDTMIDNPPELDSRIREARDTIERLRERVKELLNKNAG